jgi:hypothetical protein
MGSEAPSFRANPRALNKGASGKFVANVSPLRKFGPKRSSKYAKSVARLAVFAYILGFGIDLNVNALLILLACCSVTAVWLSAGEDTHPHRSPIFYLVALFVAVAGLSIVLSEDVARSLRLSAPLFPAVLLFFLIHEYFDDARDLRDLYVCFTIVALGLASVLLWTALTAPEWDRRSWMSEAGSPILIVANDITFLAIVAPFALGVVYQKPHSTVGTVAALALALSFCAGALYDSRGATLTFIAGTACTAAVLRFRSYLVALLLAFAVLISVAFLFESPLLSKFSHIANDGRLSHWATAWSLFLEAPLLGHGLHTYIDTSLHPQGVAWAHSLYFQTLAEQGVVGLLALLLLLSYGTVAAWKSARSPVSEQRILAAGAFGALAGFCLASLVELTLLREWVVLAMFVLLGVVARVKSAKTGG